MSSINTSAPLFSLLQQINGTNSQSQAVGNQISTGNRFGPEAAGNFSVSQGVQSELRGLDAIDQSLSSARGAGVTALAASTFTSNLLSAATTNALLALNPSSDAQQQRIFNDGFQSNLAQINQISESAEFNGTNLAADDTESGLNVVAQTDGEQLNIASEDFSTEGLSAERVAGGEDGLDDIDLTDPTTQFTDVNDIIGDAEQRLALEVGNIASGIQSADRQREFNTAIRDATEEGLGALRDADLARADARNEQIQVQQQLQFQTLNQQNQQRGSILNLFA